MWHEARKQEKKIRGLMVDYKKRAERRREFYEKIKLDPTQFLRIYGRPCKINLDPAVAIAAESPQSMMPWQGQTDNMIDRFDVRAHLDYMPKFNIVAPPTLSKREEEEERLCSYERYRTLVENECAGLTEEQCLHQIFVDEQFGPVTRSYEEEKKRALAEKKAAIGYTYDDSTGGNDEAGSDEESSDTDVETADLDITLDIDTLNAEQKEGLNLCSQAYGMKGEDYTRLLTKDKEELEALRQAKMLEEEKAQFAGRKSRRERRAYKEKRLAGRKLSPPSYAARDSPKYEPYKRKSSSSSKSRSRSRSGSPVRRQKVLFITSFGGDSEEEATIQGPSLPPQNHSDNSKGQRRSSWDKRDDKRGRGKNYHRSRSRSRSPRYRKNYREAARAKAASWRHSRSRSRSRGWDRNSSRNDKFSPRKPYSSRRRRSSSSSSSKSRTRKWRSRSRSRRSRSRSRRSRSRSRNSLSRSRRSTSRSQKRSHSRTRPSRSRSRTRPSRSRSRTRPSRSRSRSSRSRSGSHSRSGSSRSYSSRSRSSSVSPPPKNRPEPTVKRYRRESLSSKSSGSDSDNDKAEKRAEPAVKKLSTSMAAIGKVTPIAPQGMKLTPQERLKRKMQAALNRQHKADKKAEIQRQVKMEQERVDREEELRLRALEMRRRERERRHREQERQSNHGSDDDDDDDDDDNDVEEYRKSRDRNRRHSASSSGSSSSSRDNSPVPRKTYRRRSRSWSRSRSRSRDRGKIVSY